VEVGHRAVSVAHLINICRQTGRRLQWDPCVELTDYILRLQLKHFEPTNTGVLLRVQQPDRVWPQSMEAQDWLKSVRGRVPEMQ